MWVLFLDASRAQPSTDRGGVLDCALLLPDKPVSSRECSRGYMGHGTPRGALSRASWAYLSPSSRCRLGLSWMQLKSDSSL